MFDLFSRRLYLKIFLAIACGVAALSFFVAWVWYIMDEQRENQYEAERQNLFIRDLWVESSNGEIVGKAQFARPNPDDSDRELSISLKNGERIYLHMPRRVGSMQSLNEQNNFLFFLRPPYGFLWVLLIAGVVVTLCLYPVTRRMTKKLESAQKDVMRWGAGDLSVRLDVIGNDEVSDLSRSFNGAAEYVQKLIYEQKALLESQKSLLANASHELRSPLARIKMALALSSGDNQNCTFTQEINKNIKELDQLIEEILLASRLDAGQKADFGHEESIDLIGLVAEECARVGAQFSVSGNLQQANVIGEHKLIIRAVRNLLENAVRYGVKTGRDTSSVEATLSSRDDYVVISVLDEGAGVPDEQLERIFEPFYRMPNSSEKEGGVGLGLALVKSIVMRHKGSVSCKPREGGGACFEMMLPSEK